MEQSQEDTGSAGERELNPLRHVSPKPPANAGSKEFQRDMQLMEQRLAPRLSSSRARALHLEQELLSGKLAKVSNLNASSSKASKGRRTPAPQLPGLRTVIVPAPPLGTGRTHPSDLPILDPLDQFEQRLLSPEPASVALPLSPTSADLSRFLVLSSPTRETSTPGLETSTPTAGRAALVTTPGLTSGQITPPPRPTPPPSAPGRSDRRALPREFSRTPAAPRVSIQARETDAPRTAPPRGLVTYTRVGRKVPGSGPREEVKTAIDTGTTATTQQRGSRRVPPTLISAPTGRASERPFMVDVRPAAGPSKGPKLQQNLDPMFLNTPTQHSKPTKVTVPTTAKPISLLSPENTTPFPGLRTSHNIRDTLRKVAEETPKGSSQMTTPAESTVIKKSIDSSQLDEYLPEDALWKDAPWMQMESTIAESSRDLDTQNILNSSLLADKDVYETGIKSVAKGKALQSSTAITKEAPTSQELLLPGPSHTTLGLPDMDSSKDSVHICSETTVKKTLESLESLRGAIKRLESMMKDYRKNLKIDAKEIERGQKLSSCLDYGTNEEPVQSQRHHADRIGSLVQDLRNKEEVYRRDLDNLYRLDDPQDDLLSDSLDPIVARSDELNQKISSSDRLCLQDALEKLGYKKGKMKDFLDSKADVVRLFGRSPTPIIPESGGEEEDEAEYERTFMTDPGMTPRLKGKLSQLGQQEKLEKIGKSRHH
ncbi:hypothetical protein TWF730_003917 [Orbilia blumenaviensis]|uniref:Uncharacterized protein n=1 Tax=Orbilia blumenaviensis TaxID=1796055 RepID=A0AAV9U3N9_9PEZI